MKSSILEDILRVKSIADLGLLFAANEYDKERYSELRELSFEMLNKVSGHDIEELKTSFILEKEYPTVKVDVRVFVMSADHKILLIKEGVDGRWSLPGGWADIGCSPKEVAVKEAREEAGLNVRPLRLLAVFDKKMHAHPPQTHYVYKLIIQCEVVSEEENKGFEVLGCGYFDVNDLPELSEDRVVKSQLELLWNKVVSGDVEPYFD